MFLAIHGGSIVVGASNRKTCALPTQPTLPARSVTLRRTLTLAFVLLGLLPCIALSWLSFSRTRDAMAAQIAQSLAVQALTLQADIDRMLFERFQNALVWSRSELMQDLRVGDVDKRVSNYLVGLADGYAEVYAGIDCRRSDGLVVASSRVADIGVRAAAAEAAALSVASTLAGGAVSLSLPTMSRLDDSQPLAIETAIASTYPLGKAAPIARLHLDWSARQISRLLDRAAVGRRLIVVIDRQGRWVAGSQALRGRALPDAASRQAGLALAGAAGPALHRATPWLDEAAIVGVGRSQAGSAMPGGATTVGFSGSGWTTLVLEPVADALAPVRAMAGIFVGLLGVVLVATLVAATLIAAAIARPIVALTETTRRYQRDGDLPAAAAPRSLITELGQLGVAYVEMIRAVERSRLELVRASQLAMLGELAAVLAHEVRTPLGILKSSAQLLRRDPALSPDSRELMGFVESETERLNRLVSSMLDTARPRRPTLAPCDMHALLRRCVQMLALQAQLPTKAGAISAPAPAPTAISLRLDATDAVIAADAEQLMQAVFNLVQNAVQACGGQGRVQLSTADDGDGLRIDCADDGPGIAAEIVDRIFDPFFSRRDGGIGLGLSVVQQVIQAHGGRISVGRSDWGGTVFSCRLPRRHDAALPALPDTNCVAHDQPTREPPP
jgi:signal transduction histidine kinase